MAINIYDFTETDKYSHFFLVAGQKFAMMELKVILATLLRNFTIESTQKTADLRPNPGLVLQPSGGIMVKLTSVQ